MTIRPWYHFRVVRSKSTLLMQSGPHANHLERVLGQRTTTLVVRMADAIRSPKAAILHQIVAPCHTDVWPGTFSTRIFWSTHDTLLMQSVIRNPIGLR